MADKLKKWRRIFFIWGIVAAVVWVALALYFKPWGTELGAPGSPKRMLLLQVTDFWILKLPWTLLLFTYVLGKMRWMAPRGRYQEGVEYKFFTPYNYTAIAIMAALFAVSGISSFQVFDLPSAPAAIAAIYFNPIVAYCSVWIGGVLRALVFGQGDPVGFLLSFGLSDGFQYLLLSVLYWWFSDSRWGKNLVERVGWAKSLLIKCAWWFVIYYIVPLTLLTMYFWSIPSALYAPTLVDFLTRYILTGMVAGIAGLIVAEVMIRAVESRRKPAAPVSTG
jgi:uncharacterized membrane protein